MGGVFLGSERLPLAGCFFAAGSSGDDSSDLELLERLLAVLSSFSGVDSLGGGLLDPLALSFLTAGVLGFLEGAAFFTGVSFGGAASFLEAGCFRPAFLAGGGAFLAGDFLAKAFPRLFTGPLLRAFLAGGGRRALGGGLF